MKKRFDKKNMKILKVASMIFEIRRLTWKIDLKQKIFK